MDGDCGNAGRHFHRNMDFPLDHQPDARAERTSSLGEKQSLKIMTINLLIIKK
jgi:hypothetical protein